MTSLHELRVLQLRLCPEPLGLYCIAVSDEKILPSKSARNIGVMFDITLLMEQQVSSICKLGVFQIRNIA
jgi:hypothetical protein